MSKALQEKRKIDESRVHENNDNNPNLFKLLPDSCLENIVSNLTHKQSSKLYLLSRWWLEKNNAIHSWADNKKYVRHTKIDYLFYSTLQDIDVFDEPKKDIKPKKEIKLDELESSLLERRLSYFYNSSFANADVNALIKLSKEHKQNEKLNYAISILHRCVIDFSCYSGSQSSDFLLNSLSRILYCLKVGACPNVIDDKGNTALHYACLTPKIDNEDLEGIKERQFYLIKILLKYHGKLNVKNNEGETPLHFVSKSIETEKIPVISLDREFNISKVIEHGIGVKHTLQKDLIELLINLGADPKIQNNEGNTFLHSALSGKESSTVLINDLIEGLKLNQHSDLFSIENNYGLTIQDILLPKLQHSDNAESNSRPCVSCNMI